MEIMDVAVLSTTKYNKVSWFEATVTICEDEKIKRFSIDFPISELKEMDVCKNMNGWKKVREWANSDSGHEYIIKNKGRKDMMTLLREKDAG